MASREPPSSNMPVSMGPGARPLQPGEQQSGSLLQEISAVRSHYNVHVENSAINLSYQLHEKQRAYRLPFDKIPLGTYHERLCWGSPNAATITGTLLIDMIRGCENITGQTVTQSEAEGLAFYGTRRMLTLYVGQIAGIGIGAYAAWRSRKTMKFPFMSPKPAEKYQNFPGRAMPLITGAPARLMWHMTRANLYIFMWLFLSSPIFRSVADTRMTVGLYADSRTHDLTERIKGKYDRLRSNRAQEAANRITGGQPPQPANTSDTPDDGSPQSFYGSGSQSSSGQDSFAGDSSYTDGNTDTGVMTDSAMARRDTQRASPNSWSEAQTRDTRGDYRKPETRPSSDFFFDDASPTAGNDPDMTTPQPYTRQQSGPGAWDRLRRGGAPASTSPANQQASPTRSYGARNSPDFETKSDSFSFSSSEEDKRLAKDQAQADFDAMLERERNQGGKADYVRGMDATESGSESPNSGGAWSRRRGS